VEKHEKEGEVKENTTVIVDEDSDDDLPMEPDMSDSDSDDDVPARGGVDVDALAEGTHTGLVKSMLDGVREEQTKSKSQRKAEQSLQARHQKEVLEKDVQNIREIIQQITRNTNPLGKTMDYVQEDFEHMNKELDDWKTQRTDNTQRLEHEQQITEESLQPLHAELGQVENEISDWKEKIHRMKQTVEANDNQISKLLGMVVNR
jgi:TRAF3-interacting protein 1